jgi:hypothetical protein
MHSVFALAQFEHGCFLSHLTFRLLHVMQERGFGAKGPPFKLLFLCTHSGVLPGCMCSSDMAAHVQSMFLQPQEGSCLKPSSLLTERLHAINLETLVRYRCMKATDA